jgi:hypothetical protein
MHVDDVRTGTHLWTPTVCYGDSFTFLLLTFQRHLPVPSSQLPANRFATDGSARGSHTILPCAILTFLICNDIACSAYVNLLCIVSNDTLFGVLRHELFSSAQAKGPWIRIPLEE